MDLRLLDEVERVCRRYRLTHQELLELYLEEGAHWPRTWFWMKMRWSQEYRGRVFRRAIARAIALLPIPQQEQA